MTVALATGEGISQEEIRKKVEARVNGTSLAITFPEFQRGLNQFPNIIKEEYILSQVHSHIFNENGICVCGASIERKQEPTPIIPATSDETMTVEIPSLPEEDIDFNENRRHL